MLIAFLVGCLMLSASTTYRWYVRLSGRWCPIVTLSPPAQRARRRVFSFVRSPSWSSLYLKSLTLDALMTWLGIAFQWPAMRLPNQLKRTSQFLTSSRKRRARRLPRMGPWCYLIRSRLRSNLKNWIKSPLILVSLSDLRPSILHLAA